MAQIVLVAALLGVYLVAAHVQWKRGSMRDQLHAFFGVLAAFVGLLLNACAIADHEKRLDQYLQTASVDAYYDDDWNIYLQLLGDPDFVLPKSIKITPTFYKRGMRPLPTHTGSSVELYEGDYDSPEPGRSVVIREADNLLCGRQPDESACQDMTLVHVSAQLGEWTPVRVDRRIPSNAN